jgi:dTDP-4-amino-4,6-dideoxygalactose transaminase
MPEKYHHTVVGRNERMDGIQGAVLTKKLQHLDKWNDSRRQHALLYRELLKDHAKITLFRDHADRSSNYHLFVICIDRRDAVQLKLKERGIATGIHYPIPIHEQRAYFGIWKKGDFPIAEKMAPTLLSLPMYAEMTEDMVREVCKNLCEVLEEV